MVNKKNNKKRVGILGGTFNPIHFGHIRLAEKAVEAAALDQVLFIPSGVSYMKDQSEILPARYRAEMVELAVSDNSAFTMSTIEIDKAGNSYSHETIRALQEREPDTTFFFLTGADTVCSMAGWKDPASIFEAVTILAAYRSSVSIKGLKEQIEYLHDVYNADIHLIAVDSIDISSSGIREAVKNGESVSELVPSSVEKYIREHHFYQN